jgi:small subunit ribosomal protein S17
MADEPENNAPEEEAEAPAATGDAADSEAVAPPEAGGDASTEEARPADETGASAEAAEPAEALSPKQRRSRERAAKAAAVPARPPRSAEERQADRDAERKRKAELRSKRRVRDRANAKKRRGDATAPLAEMRERHPGQQKTRQGVVVSDKASKTIVVRIDVARRHRSYGKVVRTSTTLHAHDEREDAHIGDTVVVRESRPLSRTKRWRLVEVVERAK